MRTLFFFALLAFAAVAHAQLPATVLELMSGNADFQVRYRANQLPEWYLNGKVYYILGSLPCANGDNPVWNGTDWTCGNFTGFPGGQSTFEKLNCLPGQNVAFNGTTYICSSDSDLLASITCPNGDILIKLGSTFVCGLDSDLLATKICNQGDILISNGTAFNCAAQTDTDTLRDLNCTAGQTVKFISGKWTCAADLDTFATISCAAGQVAKYQSGSFICGTDADYLANLTCNIGDTLVGDSQFVFRCVPQPTPPGVPVSFIDGQTLTQQSAQTDADTYFGSPVQRANNPIYLINGLQVFALSINFGSVSPRIADPTFTFQAIIYKVVSNGISTPVATVDYPAGSTATYILASLNLAFTREEGLFIKYRYGNLLAQPTPVTTVLFIRHFVF